MPALSPHELLEVRNLNVSYHDSAGSKPAVVDVDLTIRAGECLAIVGESGSGKSTVALSAMDLLSHNASLRANIAFEGAPLDRLDRERRRLLNGGDIGMVFQSPMSTLNPLRTVGSQIAQTLRIHQPELSRKERYERVDELLHKVGIPDPKRRSAQYPHQFSGGMLQRVVIAMAMANQPKLLIADEPTTALDVTVQAQIIALLRIAAVEANAALLLISHDLGLVSELADRVAVMYAGRIVEEGPMGTILTRPKHPYTQGLLATAAPTPEPGQVLPAIPGMAPQPGAIGKGCPFQPRCPVGRNREICGSHPPLANVGEQHRSACHFPEERAHYEIATDRSDAPGIADETLLEVRNIEVVFPIKSRILRRTVGRATVLRGVDLDVGVGETVAIVGETGSGKTTLARTIVGLQGQDAGTIRFPRGKSDNQAGRLEKARRAQMVFQDPKGSLNPRITVRSAIAEPLQAHGLDAGRERINELLEMVGLSKDSAERYPHQLSGGQQQRVCIARSLAIEPNVLVLDEPVSALDVSIQAQILNLLIDIQRRVGVSYVLIAHDISMVAQIAHRVAVMYLGRIVEIGDAEVVLTRPQHPYTHALLAAVPEGPTGNRTLDPPVRGEPPSPLEVIPGCAFRTRCPVAFESCRSIDPSLATTELESKAACLLIEGADK